MTLLLAFLLLTVPTDSLTLGQAYRAAAEHYPRTRETGIAARVRDLNLENLRARRLPSVSLGGQAVWYSDIAEIPLSVPGIDLPSVSHDQYRAGLTVDQLIYDGGQVGALQEVERSAGDVAAMEVAVDTYGLRERVESAWFGVLLADAERETLLVLAEDLRARLEQAESRNERGVSTGSDADVLRAELIRVGQQLDTAASRRRAGLDVLEELTGWSLGDDAELELPVTDNGPYGRRPELDLFEARRTDLDRRAAVASTATRPRVTSFADAAVGKPQGLNMFSDEIGPFFSLGIRVKWPLWDWDVSSRDRQAIRLRSEAVAAQEESFLQANRAAAATVRRDIERLEAHLEGDAEIVELRSRVAAESRSRLDHGAITATDYLVDRNAEQRARLGREAHRIQLAQARARLATILGASR